jgi:alkyl hydroperoxide reductase subunit AhpF
MPPVKIVDPAMLREALRDIAQPVIMHYYTSAVESWYSLAEHQLLEEIASASEYITLQVYAERWDAQREAHVGIARTPAIALYGERDTGIRYYGTPDGYELETFLSTLRAIAAGTPGLRPDTLAHLRQLTQPVHLEVLVSPT